MAEFIYAGDGGAYRFCSRCERLLPALAFRRTANGSFGLHCQCRRCDAEYSKAWHNENREFAHARWADYYDRKADEILLQKAERRREKPDEVKLVAKLWRDKNTDKTAAAKRARRARDLETARALDRVYNQRRRSTPKGRLEHTVRSGVTATVKSKSKLGRKTFDLLGYAAADLMAHLEKQFLDGMTWENHGRGPGCWHIDHIIPLSVFNYETPDDIDFKRAWSLKNLRPLWERDNLSKSNRLTSSFQPSLAF